MKYEFKVKVLKECGDLLSTNDFIPLQKMFDEGWEYVDKITQPVSASGGNYSSSIRSVVAVVLKKEKPDLI